MKRLTWLLILAASGCLGRVPERTEDPNRENPEAPAPEVRPPPPPPPADPGACALPGRRLWKLTPAQYTRAVQRLIPGASVPTDDLATTLPVSHGFVNEAGGLLMSEPHVHQLYALARGLAGGADLARLFTCLPAGVAEAGCVRGFVESFGARAYRRDLTAEEVGEYTGFITRETAKSGAVGAIRLWLTAVLMSPHFLFRTELGDAPAGNPAPLTPFETASALAFFLTDGPPDDELLMAARTGRLNARAGITAEAKRLLAAPDRALGLIEFLETHFPLAGVSEAPKDFKLFPNWTPALARDVLNESRHFIRASLWEHDGKLTTLLTGRSSYVNAGVATIYGLGTGGVMGKEFQKVTLPAVRAGLLTTPALLATLARDNDTDPVARGKFIREELLCHELPSAPEDLNVMAPPPDGKRTQRERLVDHSRDPGCAGCHSLMDPLGLAFETFDPIGRHRETEVGKRIDASGVLTGARPEGARFSGAAELAALLARSPDVTACFARRMFQYAAGRAPTAADACAVARLSETFAATGGDVRALAAAVSTDDSFLVRQP